MREPAGVNRVNMRNDHRVTELEILDPGHRRPGYWNRRRAAIMEGAAFELARRRAAARGSVAAVLSGWSRSLVPAAVGAAVVAAVLFTAETRRPAEPAPQLVLQDILEAEADERTLDVLLSADRTASAGAFMALVESGGP